MIDFNNIRCIVYDLDGTIINSMELHEEGWKLAAEAFFTPVSKTILKDLAGRPINEIAAHLLKTEDESRINAFVSLNHEYVLKHTDRIHLFPTFQETYREISKTHPVWVCTSSTKDFVDKIFNTNEELKPLQGKYVYREMYKKGKPSAEPLLLTFKKAGNFSGKECIYIGDTYTDYCSAKAAGAKFIYFAPDPKNEDLRIPKTITRIRTHKELLLLINGES